MTYESYPSQLLPLQRTSTLMQGNSKPPITASSCPNGGQRGRRQAGLTLAAQPTL
ncbi:hypothetical protein VL73_51 [Erwinia phage VL73]